MSVMLMAFLRCFGCAPDGCNVDESSRLQAATRWRRSQAVVSRLTRQFRDADALLQPSPRVASVNLSICLDCLLRR